MCGRTFPELSHDIVATLIRKHHIKQYKIRYKLIQLLVKFLCVFKCTDDVITVFQSNCLYLTYALVVLYNINKCHCFLHFKNLM